MFAAIFPDLACFIHIGKGMYIEVCSPPWNASFGMCRPVASIRVFEEAWAFSRGAML